MTRAGLGWAGSPRASEQRRGGRASSVSTGQRSPLSSVTRDGDVRAPLPRPGNVPTASNLGPRLTSSAGLSAHSTRLPVGEAGGVLGVLVACWVS